MATAIYSKPRCPHCGEELDEPPNPSVDQRHPCLKCGSVDRRIQSASVNATAGTHTSLKLKGRHDAQKRPFIEMISGPDFSHRLKKWVRKLRLIDRDKDVYEEEIRDPISGEVIHQTKEKLSDHTRHGSAKRDCN